jgi:hypothetical protein
VEELERHGRSRVLKAGYDLQLHCTFRRRNGPEQAHGSLSV